MTSRKTAVLALVVACFVYVLEVFLLDGWALSLLSFAVPIGILVSGQGHRSPGVVLKDKRGMLLLGVWVLMLVAVLGSRAVTERLAEAQGREIAEACGRYRQAVGRFPSRLSELAPTYLPTLPNGKWVIGSRWQYWPPKGEKEPYPGLCLHSLSYGGSCFDFPTNTLQDGPSW